MENKLNIVCLNIRSLVRHINQLQLGLAQIWLRSTDIDIIAVTETWVTCEQLTFCQIAGYAMYHQGAQDNKQAGGVAVYVKKEYSHHCSLDFDTQAQMLLLTLSSGCRHVLDLLLVYRRPNSFRNDFINELYEAILRLKKQAIILGDMNMDVISETSASVGLYKGMISTEGFKFPAILPTREEKCLDRVLVRKLSIFEENVTIEEALAGTVDHEGLLIKSKLELESK